MPDAKAKLLIVDDEVSIRTSLSKIFFELGYCVRSAADRLPAQSDIRLEIPDLILSDLNMPGLSGFEFLSEVRDQLPTVRVIALTGNFQALPCLPRLPPMRSLKRAQISSDPALF